MDPYEARLQEIASARDRGEISEDESRRLMNEALEEDLAGFGVAPPPGEGPPADVPTLPQDLLPPMDLPPTEPAEPRPVPPNMTGVLPPPPQERGRIDQALAENTDLRRELATQDVLLNEDVENLLGGEIEDLIRQATGSAVQEQADKYGVRLTGPEVSMSEQFTATMAPRAELDHEQLLMAAGMDQRAILDRRARMHQLRQPAQLVHAELELQKHPEAKAFLKRFESQRQGRNPVEEIKRAAGLEGVETPGLQEIELELQALKRKGGGDYGYLPPEIILAAQDIARGKPEQAGLLLLGGGTYPYESEMGQLFRWASTSSSAIQQEATVEASQGVLGLLGGLIDTADDVGLGKLADVLEAPAAAARKALGAKDSPELRVMLGNDSHLVIPLSPKASWDAVPKGDDIAKYVERWDTLRGMRPAEADSSQFGVNVLRRVELGMGLGEDMGAAMAALGIKPRGMEGDAAPGLHDAGRVLMTWVDFNSDPTSGKVPDLLGTAWLIGGTLGVAGDVLVPWEAWGSIAGAPVRAVKALGKGAKAAGKIGKAASLADVGVRAGDVVPTTKAGKLQRAKNLARYIAETDFVAGLRRIGSRRMSADEAAEAIRAAVGMKKGSRAVDLAPIHADQFAERVASKDAALLDELEVMRPELQEIADAQGVDLDALIDDALDGESIDVDLDGYLVDDGDVGEFLEPVTSATRVDEPTVVDGDRPTVLEPTVIEEGMPERTQWDGFADTGDVPTEGPTVVSDRPPPAVPEGQGFDVPAEITYNEPIEATYDIPVRDMPNAPRPRKKKDRLVPASGTGPAPRAPSTPTPTPTPAPTPAPAPAPAPAPGHHVVPGGAPASPGIDPSAVPSSRPSSRPKIGRGKPSPVTEEGRPAARPWRPSSEAGPGPNARPATSPSVNPKPGDTVAVMTKDEAVLAEVVEDLGDEIVVRTDAGEATAPKADVYADEVDPKGNPIPPRGLLYVNVDVPKNVRGGGAIPEVMEHELHMIDGPRGRQPDLGAKRYVGVRPDGSTTELLTYEEAARWIEKTRHYNARVVAHTEFGEPKNWRPVFHWKRPRGDFRWYPKAHWHGSHVEEYEYWKHNIRERHDGITMRDAEVDKQKDMEMAPDGRAPGKKVDLPVEDAGLRHIAPGGEGDEYAWVVTAAKNAGFPDLEFWAKAAAQARLGVEKAVRGLREFKLMVDKGWKRDPRTGRMMPADKLEKIMEERRAMAAAALGDDATWDALRQLEREVAKAREDLKKLAADQLEEEELDRAFMSMVQDEVYAGLPPGMVMAMVSPLAAAMKRTIAGPARVRVPLSGSQAQLTNLYEQAVSLRLRRRVGDSELTPSWSGGMITPREAKIRERYIRANLHQYGVKPEKFSIRDSPQGSMLIVEDGDAVRRAMRSTGYAPPPVDALAPNELPLVDWQGWLMYQERRALGTAVALRAGVADSPRLTQRLMNLVFGQSRDAVHVQRSRSAVKGMMQYVFLHEASMNTIPKESKAVLRNWSRLLKEAGTSVKRDLDDLYATMRRTGKRPTAEEALGILLRDNYAPPTKRNLYLAEQTNAAGGDPTMQRFLVERILEEGAPMPSEARFLRASDPADRYSGALMWARRQSRTEEQYAVKMIMAHFPQESSADLLADIDSGLLRNVYREVWHGDGETPVLDRIVKEFSRRVGRRRPVKRDEALLQFLNLMRADEITAAVSHDLIKRGLAIEKGAAPELEACVAAILQDRVAPGSAVGSLWSTTLDAQGRRIYDVHYSPSVVRDAKRLLANLGLDQGAGVKMSSGQDFLRGAVTSPLVRAEIERAARRGSVGPAGLMLINERNPIVKVLDFNMRHFKGPALMGPFFLASQQYLLRNMLELPMMMAQGIGLREGATGTLAMFRHPKLTAQVAGDASGLPLYRHLAGKIGDGNGMLVTQSGMIYSVHDLRLEAGRRGLDTSFAKVEFPDNVINDLRARNPGAWNAMRRAGIAVRDVVIETATQAELLNRTGVFIDAVKRDLGMDEAARLARESLLDYGGMTDFERDWFSRLIPFYSFTRANVDRNWRNLWRDGGKNAHRIFRQLRLTRDLESLYGLTPEERALKKDHALGMLTLWAGITGRPDILDKTEYVDVVVGPTPAWASISLFYSLAKVATLGWGGRSDITRGNVDAVLDNLRPDLKFVAGKLIEVKAGRDLTPFSDEVPLWMVDMPGFESLEVLYDIKREPAPPDANPDYVRNGSVWKARRRGLWDFTWGAIPGADPSRSKIGQYARVFSPRESRSTALEIAPLLGFKTRAREHPEWAKARAARTMRVRIEQENAEMRDRLPRDE